MAAVEAAVADRAVPSAAFPLVAVIEVAAALLVAAEAVAVFWWKQPEYRRWRF